MEVGDAYLRLDKQWDMEEFATLSKLYIQCYSLVYSLSGIKVDSNDERVIDWFQGTYAKYPWRGGFSTINFYSALYSKIPHAERPLIREIQYASPGFIKLSEVLVVAGILAGIVAAVTTSIEDVYDAYNTIQKGMSERKLTKLEIEIKELKLDESRLEFVKKSKEILIKKMKIPESMQSELARRSSENDLMELKIIMSFLRRLEPLTRMQQEGMLLVEEPSDKKSNKTHQD